MLPVRRDTRSCPVCRVDAPRRYDRPAPLYRCPRCTLLFHDAAVLDGHDDLYSEGYFTGAMAGGVGYADYLAEGDWYSSRVYDEIRPWLHHRFPHRGALLDVGCAAGFLVEAAVGDGWDATGIDVSRYAVESGRARGLDLRAGMLEAEAFPAASFDAITSFHTIEHVPDPIAVLTEMRRIAKAGATLIVEVPNLRSIGFLIRRERWAQLKPPEHLSHFNRRSLGALLRSTQWRPVRWQTPYLPEVAEVAAGGRLGSVVQVAGRLGATDLLARSGMGANLRGFAVAV